MFPILVWTFALVRPFIFVARILLKKREDEMNKSEDVQPIVMADKSAQLRNLDLIGDIVKSADLCHSRCIPYRQNHIVFNGCFYENGITEMIAKHVAIFVSEDGTMNMTVEWGNSIVEEVKHNDVLSYLREMTSRHVAYRQQNKGNKSAQLSNIDLINDIIEKTNMNSATFATYGDHAAFYCSSYGPADPLGMMLPVVTTIFVSEDGTMNMTVKCGNSVDEISHDGVLSCIREIADKALESKVITSTLTDKQNAQRSLHERVSS